ncbi:MAG: 5-formyltetrahydrofolate cyclo-ligase [Planctomycetes bacterium]|nr:5-formyltetrahydrofolate cyclo-ligase [Planctomycetota bacterium]
MKNRIRQEIRQRIAGLDQMVRYARGLAACKHLTCQEEFLKADVVMIFLSMPDEVDTTPVALAAWQMDKTVLAPAISWQHRRLTPMEITSLETGIKTIHHAIPEPTENRPVTIEMIDLIIVPALAYDRTGHRLGRGHGFYDRFLAHDECHARTCGLILREQLVDSLPVQPHDISVDMVVTDEDVLRFNR